MSDPIPTPGVRPGQRWEEIRGRKGRPRRRWLEIDYLMSDFVMMKIMDERGQPTGRTSSALRQGFEQRYRLVSEGGEPA